MGSFCGVGDGRVGEKDQRKSTLRNRAELFAFCPRVGIVFVLFREVGIHSSKQKKNAPPHN